MDVPTTENDQNDEKNENMGAEGIVSKRTSSILKNKNSEETPDAQNTEEAASSGGVKVIENEAESLQTMEIHKLDTVGLVCTTCDGVFHSEESLETHMQGVHNVGIDGNEESLKDIRYSCNICHEKFDVKDELVAHLKSNHVQHLQKAVNSLHNKHYHCDKCACSFSSVNFLKRHELTKHGVEYKKDDLKLGCTHCDEVFDCQHHLTLHQLHKHEAEGNSVEKPCLSCPECGMKFFKERQYMMHRKKHHGLQASEEEKVFICETCGRSFRRADTLKMHRNSVHLGVKRTWKPRTERSFVCEVCGNGFLSKGHLKEHFLVKHSSDPYAFKCKHCPRSFIRAGVLEYHENKYHHGKKPYVCEQCSKAFYSKFSLHDHKKICCMPDDLKISCDKCERTFKSKHNLNLHMQAVHSSPALVCDCGTVVRWASSVTKHLRRCVLNKHNLALSGLVKTEPVESVAVGSNYLVDKGTGVEDTDEAGFVKTEEGPAVDGVVEDNVLITHEGHDVGTAIAVEGAEIVGEEARTVEEVIDAASSAMTMMTVQPAESQANLQDVYYVILK